MQVLFVVNSDKKPHRNNVFLVVVPLVSVMSCLHLILQPCKCMLTLSTLSQLSQAWHTSWQLYVQTVSLQNKATALYCTMPELQAWYAVEKKDLSVGTERSVIICVCEQEGWGDYKDHAASVWLCAMASHPAAWPDCLSPHNAFVQPLVWQLFTLPLRTGLR